MLLNRLSRRRAPLEYNSHEPRGRFQLELPQLVFNASTNAYEGLSLSHFEPKREPRREILGSAAAAAFLMRRVRIERWFRVPPYTTKWVKKFQTTAGRPKVYIIQK